MKNLVPSILAEELAFNFQNDFQNANKVALKLFKCDRNSGAQELKPSNIEQISDYQFKSFKLPSQLLEALRECSEILDKPLVIILLTAWICLLYRYEEDEDLTISVSGHGNFFKQNIENNSTNLSLTLNLKDELLFTELLKSVDRLILKIKQQYSIHGEAIIDYLEVEDYYKSDLRLNVVINSEVQSSLQIYLIYNSKLFKKAEIERIIGHFQRIVQGIVQSPQQSLGRLPLLTEQEKEQVLGEWNNTATDYPRNSTIANLFAQQVAQNPKEIALIWQGQQLTYQELDYKSNQLAYHLQELGVRTETLVALYLERTPAVIISMLAILKAGGAYLPLEISAPKQRIAQILEDAEIHFLITQQLSLNQLPPLSSKTQVICLDLEQEKVNNYPTIPAPVNGIEADNLAYVTYTSGSTGKPKGVCVTHRGVIRLVKNTNYAELDSEQVILQAAPIAFDASTFEIWGALLNGGKLVLMPQSVPSLQELGAAIQEYHITTLWLTAGLFHLMVAEQIDALKPLQQLLAGGDVLSVAHVQKVLTQLPDCRLINGYGPTENTTFTCCYPLQSGENLVGSVPIGYPIANTQVYILDRHLQPVPVGIPGELYIGGDGLARGYLNQPELTAERFIANPFSKVPDSRLYKTGDRVRWRDDGAIEFLGRIDYQVKIRGFRLELGEIEAVLAEYPHVRDAVVLAREDRPRDKRLVAYVVPKDSSAKLNLDKINHFLADKLPEYMIPSAFVLLDELPLNANGKVDRHSLPAPLLNLEREVVKPRNSIESKIAAIWQEVLGFEVGIDESFTSLGGNSLQATQIVSRLRDAFGVELPVSAMLQDTAIAQRSGGSQHPTLVQWIANDSQTEDSQEILALQPRERDYDLPLTAYQERIWLLAQRAEGHPIYNLAMAFRLHGELHLEVLDKALNEIVKRHESLRTIFPLVNGLPIQRILPQLKLTISLEDVRVNSQQEREAQIATSANQEASKPFNLQEDAPIRVKLVKLGLGTRDHVLIITCHHIISDGWSLGVLLKELSATYSSLLTESPLNLPELTINYGDFTLWHQQQQRQQAREASLLEYWTRQLEGAPPLLKLPSDRPRTPLQTFRGSVQTFAIEGKLRGQLANLSKNTGNTLFMVLVAAFLVLMHRYSGQDDIVIGSPIANRNHTSLENLIGCLVNVVPLRSKIEDNLSFPEFLERVKQVSLDAYTYLDFPLEKLLSQLKHERDLSYLPWFQVVFVFLNVPKGELELPGLSVTERAIQKKSTIFDLTVLIEQKASGLKGSIEYNTDLYDHETITRLIKHFQVLLQAIAANPQQNVKNLPLLTKAEKQKILVDWNDTKVDYPKDKCIHQLFETQVEKTPDAVALVCEGKKLTYRQLNEKANRLAHYLQKLGIKPETLVGICAERSLEMIVALLGILKAGGAYVPLDPSYPAERLKFMLEDTEVPILLTTKSLAEYPFKTKATIVNLLDSEEINLSPPDNPNVQIKSDNLAYLIYTSGSTGRPKGVLIPHRGVVRLVKNANYISFSEGEVFLQLSPFSFDAATLEIWGSLLNGSKLAMVASPQPSLAEIAKTIEREQVTTLWLTSSLFNLMVEEKLDCLQSVRQLLAGGDVLSAVHVKKAQMKLKECKIINGYGPTENTTFSCCYTIPQEQKITTSIPIGRPINNTQVYILDANLQANPIGVAGEIYIGGDGLARGYLNRPQLRAEKFIDNPFGEGKLYKTGDRGRYLPDGNIEFLGRSDYQVKIRGFRIELGEIEANLNQHPQIKESLVIARENQQGAKYLAAYLVTNQGNKAQIRQLRQFLSEKLPEYMIPSAFVFLDSFPLNNNGKIDRKALPDPDFEASREQEFISPRNQTEAILATIWQEVLSIAKIGIDDNFFALGGHSLLATQMFARIQSIFKVELPLRYLFQSPTIADLGVIIDKYRKEFNSISIPIVARQEQLPLSFTQERLWFINQLEGASPLYNLPTVVKIEGELKIEALEKAIAYIVQRHESLRSNFKTKEGQPYLIINPEVDSCLQVVNLENLHQIEKQQQVEQIIRKESNQVFDLEQDTLVKFTLLKVSTQEYILISVIHHIVSDGWSIGILNKELSHLYQAYSQNTAPTLPSLPIQYVDFAAWQKKYLTGKILADKISYWREKLENYPPLSTFPTDYSRPATHTFLGAKYQQRINNSLKNKLKNFNKTEGITLFIILLTALKILLYRHTKQEKLIIGFPIASRNNLETEKLIGFFANTLLVSSDLRGEIKFRELLHQVKNFVFKAYENQDIPFEKLVQELKIERSINRNPLFQIWLNMVNLESPFLDLKDLKIEFLSEIDTEVNSKFDLTIYARELEDNLQLIWVYNRQLYKETTIKWLAQQYQTLLEQVIVEPEQKIDEIILLKNNQCKKSLLDKNIIINGLNFNIFLESEIEQAITQRFEKQVELYPDKLAIKSRKSQWTYRQLNQKANAIASQILALSTPELKQQQIALLFEHDAEMIASILAVLKAGKTYVPLDANCPEERLNYILQDSQANLLLTNTINSNLAKKLNQENILVINIDGIETNPEKSDNNVSLALNSQTLAYILYTSGSTGKPKGVIQNHRNVLHFIRNYTNNLHICQEDRISLLASISFDAAVMDIFGALLNGATLCLYDVKSNSLNQLAQWLFAEKITIYHSTPTLYRYLLKEISTSNQNFLSHIRFLVLGGEQVLKRDVELYQTYFSDNCLFFNGYGSTESSFNLRFIFDKNTIPNYNFVPLGFPFENTEILLLDSRGNETQIYGEIAIKSEYIARGYWQNPELTKQVFLADSENTNRRIYRTGDWGRLRSDGTIEFLGRKDFQIKIRGFRLELGEIEANLNQHPQIKESAVIAREDNLGEKRLIAYLVPKPEQSLSSEELRTFLKHKLPDYMIPSAFVSLEALPLTPNGKVDRKALPAPEQIRLGGEESFVAPRDEIELQLTKIWERVLDTQPVGVRDNFFDLGGHSLLAVRLIAEIEKAYQKHLPLATLFQAATVEGIAQILRQENESVSWSSLVTIQPGGSKPPFFCCHGIYGNVLFFRDLARYLGPEQPFYGLQARGLDGKTAPHTRVEDMAAQYIQEIRQLQQSGPYFLGGFSFGGTVALEIAQQLAAQGEEVALLALFDRPGPNIPPITLVDWLKGHLINLSQLKLKEKLQYLSGGVKWHIKTNRLLYMDELPLDREEIEYIQQKVRYQNVLKANLMANRNYIPRPYPAKLTLFQAQRGSPRSRLDSQGGWGEIALGGVEVHQVPGDHAGILKEPNVQILAEKLRACIERAL